MTEEQMLEIVRAWAAQVWPEQAAAIRRGDWDTDSTIYDRINLLRFAKEHGMVMRPSVGDVENALPTQEEEDVRYAAEFLADRVRELESSLSDGIDETVRDYYGHVVHALARLEKVLASKPTRVQQARKALHIPDTVTDAQIEVILKGDGE